MTGATPDGAVERIVAGAVVPGVHYCAEPRDTAWRDRAESAGWRPYALHTPVTAKAAFLDDCAETFAFPDWFGANWDALEDCLTDLSWSPAASGRVVLWTGWPVLAAADEGDFRTALDVFTEAVAVWRDSGTPLAMLLAADQPCEDDPQ